MDSNIIIKAIGGYTCIRCCWRLFISLLSVWDCRCTSWLGLAYHVPRAGSTCFFCRHNIYDIAGGTIVSSLNTNRVVRKFGTGLVTAVSVLMTAVALFGFSVSKTFWMLCLWSIPYGLGAGAVDSALNNFVALHYASRHMSWLHCFGV